MFYNGLPSIDLHGENRESARVLLNEFINDNYKLHYKNLIIIHGKGSGILKSTVHEELRRNKLVKSFKLDFFNDGQTLVEILEKK
ncbi:MAG: Smr/MutS family protein [bacterium]|nr:Smr/MutS family protein [bacterium]